MEGFLSTKLKLNQPKTQLLHFKTNRVRYLGFEIAQGIGICDLFSGLPRAGPNSLYQRQVPNTKIQVYAPITRLIELLIGHGFALNKDKPQAVTR